MDALARDLRFAFRLIRKAPVLSIATIVTLALGIGLNTGVFTVISGLLLRPRVTVRPASFVHLQPEYSGRRIPIHESPALSTADYVALRDRALGASRADITRLVLTSGAGPIAAGVGGGLLLVIPAAIASAVSSVSRRFRCTPPTRYHMASSPWVSWRLRLARC